MSSSPTSSQLRSLWNAWPGRIVRLLLALLPLLWLSRRVQLSAVMASARRVGPAGLGSALLVFFIAMVIGAWRWRVLLSSYGADPATLPSHTTLLRHHYIGHYFSVLPTGVVGEAVRAMRVADTMGGVAQSVAVLLVERLAGLLALLAIAATASLLGQPQQGDVIARAMGLAALAVVPLGVLVLLVPAFASRVPRLRALMARTPLRSILDLPAAHSLRGPLLAMVSSVFVQFGVVLTIAVLIAPLDPHATLLVCSRVVPAIVLVTYIPLTPGGLGQRELAAVYFFSAYHVRDADAIAASLLYLVVSLTHSLLGGLVLLVERTRRPA